MNMSKKSAQSGFTLVELIVVIIILAILGAVALPKFIDVTEKAQISAVKGAGGGLGAGVALFHAQWVANGHTAAEINVDGFGGAGASFTVDANESGWPVGTEFADAAAATNPTITTTMCTNIWNGVMQGPPTIDTAAANKPDYVVTVSSPTCTYTYHGGQVTAPQPDGSNDMTITYNTDTGAVAVNNLP